MIRLRPLIYELKIITKQRGIVKIREVINASQELLITEAEHQLNTTGKIRMDVLKARQMGISTIIEAIIFALSILYSDFQSLIISHESESAEHILGMTKRYWQTYTFNRFHDEKYAARKQLAWSDLGSNIVVATAKNVDAGRSKTLHALHASEVAFWDDPETLVDGLRQAIPNQGVTAIFNESTANGIGNYFHSHYLDAVNNRNEFKAMFFPWWQFPEYDASHLTPEEVIQHPLTDLSEDEKILMSMGIGETRLIWRRWAIANLTRGDIDKFKQEYPATWQEAFLSTGRNVFRLPALMRHYLPMKPKRGYLARNNQGQVVLINDPQGALKVYRFPNPDRNWGVYQIGADPTHTTVGDNACAQVINRRTLEQCAVLSDKITAHELGAQLMLLGEYYNMATIAPEKTGPGYGTVAWLKAKGYPAVWETAMMVKTPGQVQDDTWGWVSNNSSKTHAIGLVVQAIEQELQTFQSSTYGLVIHDAETFEEMRDYVTTENGGFENGNGSKNDDTVMALAIALATHFHDPPPLPYTPDRPAHDIAQHVAEKIPELVAKEMTQDRHLSGIIAVSGTTDQPFGTDEESTQHEPGWEAWETE